MAKKKGKQGEKITELEKEILVLIALGLENKQIAEKMYFSLATVSTHIHNIKAKTSIKSRTLLAFYALDKGYMSETRIKSAIARQQWMARLAAEKQSSNDGSVAEQQETMTGHSPQSKL